MNKNFQNSLIVSIVSIALFLFCPTDVYAQEYESIEEAKQVLTEQSSDFEASRYLFHKLETSEYLDFMQSLEQKETEISFDEDKYRIYNFDNYPEVYFILIDIFEDFDYLSSRDCKKYYEGPNGSCRFGRDYMIRFIDGKYVFFADISNAFSEYSNGCNQVFGVHNNMLITYSTDMCGSNADDIFHQYRYYDFGNLDQNMQPQYLYTEQQYTSYAFFMPVGFIFLSVSILFTLFMIIKIIVEISTKNFTIKSLKLRLLIFLLLAILASTSWWVPQRINIRQFENVSASCYLTCGG
jgi:hypothetical protein